MSQTPIFYTKPSITALEHSYVNDAIVNGWGKDCYGYITKFEEHFKKHLQVKCAISTSSCTGALHMGLTALGVKEGDEVILPEITWIASFSPITYLGATPVLVDVLEESWCIDPKKVEQAITPMTKAIIAVHVYGNLCDMDSLLAIGKKYNIPVIEDAAEAIGSVYRGKKAGSMGAFGIFSFHGTKTVTTGEGGMFVTNDEDLYDKVLTLSNHGRSNTQTKQFWPNVIGYKYKMSNIQAAIGCAQIERMSELIGKKRLVLEWYKEAFKELPLSMNPEPKDCEIGAWMSTIVINKDIFFDREALFEEFKANNIDGRVFFWPLSLIIKDFEKPCKAIVKDTPTAYSLYGRAINLPSYHDLAKDDIERVVRCVKNVLM